MFWLILLCIIIVLSFGFGIFFIVTDGFDGEEFVMFFIGLPVISLFLVFCFGLFSSIIFSSFCNVEYSLSETKQIIALQDNSAIEGSFFLGSGYVDEEPVYYYMVEEEFGYKMDTISTKSSYIKYLTSNEKPYYEIHQAEFTNPVVNFFTLGPMHDNRTIFYVPEGSIVEEFNIDLQNN